MPAIWGGEALVRAYGKPGDPAQHLGESWECWDANRIASGPHAGATLAAARVADGAELMGPLDPAQPFPLLTKIIDAHDALSVQVHPDDAYARRVEHQANGKTECWYVLRCAPGAEIVLGWSRDTSREGYERRVADGTLAEILRRVPVRAGEAFYLPAGTLHAIGPGIELFEAQQASDLTYRIFDWNRVGADGAPRALHVEKAADVLDYRATYPSAVAPLEYALDGLDRTLIVADARFLLERATVRRLDAYVATDGLPLAITAMDAHVRIDLAPGEGVLLEPWQTALVPAAAGRAALVPGGERTSVLLAQPSPNRAAVRARLTAAGVPDPAVAGFFAQFG
ncbi:MAG TPA: type I phosphomannose isomerase catalytic subunit [Candidatus Elarobacter sp.]|nr:type I phosphomannose isomerase catalytic subunit [Candidatus Elarobacter sp.]